MGRSAAPEDIIDSTSLTDAAERSLGLLQDKTIPYGDADRLRFCMRTQDNLQGADLLRVKHEIFSCDGALRRHEITSLPRWNTCLIFIHPPRSIKRSRSQAQRLTGCGMDPSIAQLAANYRNDKAFDLFGALADVVFL
jgi:hypothetical protein